MSAPDPFDRTCQEPPPTAAGESRPASDWVANPAENLQWERRIALDCWYLTGATASGKSTVSLKLAQKLDAEIISLDSMAVYRGMDIGTAKPSLEAQQTVPHHLIDILDPTQMYSVSEYRTAALQTIQQVRNRGRNVLFVGGSALYLKALLRGLFHGPPADWDLRNRIESEMAECDATELHRRLESVDPVAAHKLHVNDRRRIIRALEVYYQTGIPISHWQMEFDQVAAPEQCRVFTLRHPRHVLHERIERRVHEMFERGLIEEVSDLLSQWEQLSTTAAQAVGYREVIEHLRGERDRESTIEKVLTRTRRFARHQETWFRGLDECRIFDIPQPYDAEQVAEQVFQLGR